MQFKFSRDLSDRWVISLFSGNGKLNFAGNAWKKKKMTEVDFPRGMAKEPKMDLKWNFLEFL